jgi:hypothetical protein
LTGHDPDDHGENHQADIPVAPDELRGVLEFAYLTKKLRQHGLVQGLGRLNLALRISDIGVHLLLAQLLRLGVFERLRQKKDWKRSGDHKYQT